MSKRSDRHDSKYHFHISICHLRRNPASAAESPSLAIWNLKVVRHHVCVIKDRPSLEHRIMLVKLESGRIEIDSPST
jgi:hypothetical protein